MQPARIKLHATKEHTNNPVQRPHFRGQGTKRGPRKLSQPPEGESVITPRETDPKDQAPRPPEAANSDRTVGNRGREVLRCGGAGESDEFQRAGLMK
jgi:hypothetical protein